MQLNFTLTPICNSDTSPVFLAKPMQTNKQIQYTESDRKPGIKEIHVLEICQKMRNKLIKRRVETDNHWIRTLDCNEREENEEEGVTETHLARLLSFSFSSLSLSVCFVICQYLRETRVEVIFDHRLDMCLRRESGQEIIIGYPIRLDLFRVSIRIRIVIFRIIQ